MSYDLMSNTEIKNFSLRSNMNKIKLKIIRDSSLDGHNSAWIYGDLNKVEKIMNKEDYSFISSEDLVKLRVQEGADTFVSKVGTITRDAVIKNHNNGFYYIVKNLLPNEIDSNLEQSLLEDAFQTPKELQSVSINYFHNSDILKYLLNGRANASDYGQFLKENGIDKFGFSLSMRYELDHAIQNKRIRKEKSGETVSPQKEGLEYEGQIYLNEVNKNVAFDLSIVDLKKSPEDFFRIIQKDYGN